MGLLDNLGGLLQGSGTTTEPIELQPGERELFRTPGSVGPQGLSAVGGDLVVTNQRLLFTPLNTNDVAALLKAGLKRAGAPNNSTVLVGWFADYVTKSAVSSAVASIRVGREASLLHPPSVVVTGSEGQSYEFGVLATRLSPNPASHNSEARRQLISVVESNLLRPSPGCHLGPVSRTERDDLREAAASGRGPGAAPRISGKAIAEQSSVALSDAEIEANSEYHEDKGRYSIFFPLARDKTSEARLEASLVGNWAVPDLGSITMDRSGGLIGVMQMFGALPPGRVTGQWWVDGQPQTLVLNFVCVQSDEKSAVEFATSWPMILRRISGTEVVTDIGDERAILQRLS